MAVGDVEAAAAAYSLSISAEVHRSVYCEYTKIAGRRSRSRNSRRRRLGRGL